MLNKLKVSIKTLAPVVIPVTLGEVNVVQTAQHLSGSVILGLFAAEYIKHNNKANNQPEQNANGYHEEGNFYSWFLSGDLKYEHAYPSSPNGHKRYLPCPLFLHQEKGDKNKLQNIFTPVDIETKAIEKYVAFNGNEVDLFSPPRRLFFHHRRDNRLAARSEEGGIFNYEAIEKDQHFTCYIAGDSSTLEAFHQHFSSLQNSTGSSFKARVGRSRNTQYGWVEVTIHKPEPVVSGITAESADKLKGDEPQSVYLTLTAPLIIHNECGYPEVTVENLDKILLHAIQDEKITVEKITIKKALSRSETVENFVSVWRLKRPLEYAFKAGSAFEVALPENSESKEAIITSLDLLGQSGLGERTHEGFGRFKLALSFPKEYVIPKNAAQDEPLVVKKPSDKMPEPLKYLTSKILREHLHRLVENKAFIDAKAYAGERGTNLPTNSLLGRLELMAAEIPVANSSQGQDSFSSVFSHNTEKLKKPAKDQLKRCWRSGQNLHDLLMKGELQDENLKSCDLNDKEKELAKLAKFNYKEDQGLNNSLQKTYWLTLFRRMRKLNREVK